MSRVHNRLEGVLELAGSRSGRLCRLWEGVSRSIGRSVGADGIEGRAVYVVFWEDISRLGRRCPRGWPSTCTKALVKGFPTLAPRILS